MAKQQGRIGRTLGRAFRERQIYHRSDGVVRFIKLTARTQVAMACVTGGFLLWVAFASTNFVFDQQIDIAREQEQRNERAAYRRKLQSAESAYDEVNALNFIYAREFDATISGLKSQTDTLRGLVENKATVDSRLRALADTLSATGAPGGRDLKSGNRVMIDPVGREPTPRQSRVSALRGEALRGGLGIRVAEGIEDEMIEKMRQEGAELSARQVVLMASLEEDMRQSIQEMREVLSHTGVAIAETVVPNRPVLAIIGEDGEMTGQGGPFIPAEAEAAGTYYRSAARVSRTLSEMIALGETVKSVPLSSPVAEANRMTSRYGTRWDPVKKNRRAQHKGLDFAAYHKTPLLATAPGRVTFAGTRGGFGRTVEIDHGNGFKTRYAHMHTIKVRSGQKVELHHVIGLMGSTGRSTGTHVHYEVLYKGRQVDPLKFIEAGRYVFES